MILAVLLGAVITLTACTPADEPIAAPAVRDGRPGCSTSAATRFPSSASTRTTTRPGLNHARPVRFTVADFTRIGGDQVLVRAGRDKTEVVSRNAFIRTADATCE
jgi:hypothetical protein